MADNQFTPEDIEGAADRFWSRVNKTTEHECWTRAASTDRYGYGKFTIRDIFFAAHRYAWTHHNGRSIPHGYVVMHKCDNPACVNPAHLELGTQLDNIADRVIKGRSALGRVPNPVVAQARMR